MTNPTLSVASTKDIGRLYGKPGHTYPKTINTKLTINGILAGELSPSITNIISVINPELAGYWTHMARTALFNGADKYEAMKEHEYYLKATGDRGTRVHAFIEELIENNFVQTGYMGWSKEQKNFLHTQEWKDLPTYQECVKFHPQMNDLDYINAFFRFVLEHKPTFMHQETTVYGLTNAGLRYAGTTDFIAKIGGKIIIGDWKTTSKLKHTVALQLAAIQQAKEMVDLDGSVVPMMKTDECWGVQLKKDGTYSIGIVDDVPRAFECFSSAADLWALKVGLEELLTTTDELNTQKVVA